MIEPTHGPSKSTGLNFKQFSNRYEEDVEKLYDQIQALMDHWKNGDLDTFLKNNPNFFSQLSSNIHKLQADNDIIATYKQVNTKQSQFFKKMEHAIQSFGIDKDSIMQAINELNETKLGHLLLALNDAKKAL